MLNLSDKDLELLIDIEYEIHKKCSNARKGWQEKKGISYDLWYGLWDLIKRALNEKESK